MKTPACLALAVSLLAGCASSIPSAQDKAEAWVPIIKGAHLHHVHLNVTDRKAAIAYYLKHFDAKAETFAGSQDAIWVQRSWILFNEVKERPPSSEGTAINHMGWGAPDAQVEFERQKSLGADFQTEIRHMGAGIGARKPADFSFMYLNGPNGELIELNTDPDNNFGHIHFNSAEPHLASSWYVNMFGLAPAPPFFPYLISQTGTEAMSLKYFDNVNTIFRQTPGAMKPTTGTVIDHIAVSVPNLEAALTAIRPYDVKILAAPAEGGPGWRHAFIEGPDRIAIELVEDHTQAPPITD